MIYPPNVRYWINTVSRDHVRRGVEGGFTQADHGKATRLRKLAQGDLIVFYSPRMTYPDGEPLQCFTAMGRVMGEEPYQVMMSETFHPWRLAVEFFPSGEAPIQPLLDALDFIPDRKRWGYKFRLGLFEIGQDDFQRIAAAMGVQL